MVGRPFAQRTAYVNQLYLRARYQPFEIRAGRFADILGIVDSDLSTGSFARSENTTPLPAIALLTPDFVAVPWTDGLVHARGYLSHSWLEKERYVPRPLMHEKYAYVRLGGSHPVNVHAGLVHAVMWAGGLHPTVGELPGTFRDFLSVFFGKGGPETAPAAEHLNALGNHLGFWDFGLQIRLRRYSIGLYRHFTIDDDFGLSFETPQDGILGISLKRNGETGFVTGILWEHYYTKRQSNLDQPWTPGQISNYYNHFLYRSGWTYYGRALGSPLLFVRKPNFDPTDDRIVNESNRIVAHHVGIEGFLARTWHHRTLLTYSRNYGQYTDYFTGGLNAEPRFADGPRQVSVLLELTSPELTSGLSAQTAIAVDVGHVRQNQFGVMLGLVWAGTLSRRISRMPASNK